jgi:CRP/FNR family transcriptional regulator
LLKAAKRDAKVALRLYEALSRELVATREHLLCVGQRGASERLATFLVILSRRNETRGYDPETIKLPMTRADIADFLGVTIETVSRTFSKLRNQGLIEIDQVDYPPQEYWQARATCGR